MQRIPLLDLGNVVVKVDFAPFLAWLTEKSEARDPEKTKSLLSSSLFYDFEFGHLTPEAFAKRLASHFRAEIDPNELEQRFCDIFPGLVEGMEPLIGELAQQGPIYCLTNTNQLHLNHIRRRFPVMAHFTKVFASHEIRKRKPYPGIYRDVADDLAVAPEALVFFDDVHANVQGALRAGLEAYLFSGADQLRNVMLSTSSQPATNSNRE